LGAGSSGFGAGATGLDKGAAGFRGAMGLDALGGRGCASTKALFPSSKNAASFVPYIFIMLVFYPKIYIRRGRNWGRNYGDGIMNSL
jgi:hypothetical protein